MLARAARASPRDPIGGPAHHDPVTMILLCAGRGDEAAFAELYDGVADRVYGIALRVLRDPQHAEEVAHEIFLELWRSAARFDPSLCSAQGWIATIAHRRAVDRVRSGVVIRRVDDSVREPGDEPGQAGSVVSAMARLPANQRRAVELAYFDGHSSAEVARLMQAPLSTTKNRLRTALVTLRSEMDPPGNEVA